ncbi:MAG: deoxyguanosinetriphosphate triphosphohydrolase [Rhodoferax sp.]|nr:deoxyguanosinetriphosphate triphosphohydrolase [Rhodoferax sp.]
MHVASYACDAAQSRGRRYPQADAPTRTGFQRDRDRIVHSTAFRRLVYKTQVFLNHEGDLFRTRLTHSLEVAQLGRSMARSLGLSEDLVETIALAHDLGHTPFGHAGQDALHACMVDYGGFEHNLQSLRVVDVLEERYPEHDGLNLCFESREGILKHCARTHAEQLEAWELPYADGDGGVGARFLRRTQPSLEAQLCNLADEVAYNAHDIDDGVRSGLLSLDQLLEVPLFARHAEAARQCFSDLGRTPSARRWLYETLRRMLSAQVYDLLEATNRVLAEVRPNSVQEVRQCGQNLVRFSDTQRAESQVLKSFLFKHLYRHPQVMRTMEQAKGVVAELFVAYRDRTQEMGPDTGLSMDRWPDAGALPLTLERRVADYIAGMTDRFALQEHARLTGRRVLGV